MLYACLDTHYYHTMQQKDRVIGKDINDDGSKAVYEENVKF